jgi:hypothetical protein
MILGRLLPTLVVVVVFFGVAIADSGSGSGSGSSVPVATGSGSAVTPAELPDEITSVQTIAKAVHAKDWFLLAGAALALGIHLARHALKKKWPRWGESHYAVFLAAGMAGLAALAIAWLTPGAEVASSHTLVGALKLLAGATLAYVVPKKLAQGVASTGKASSSDVPT